MGIVGYRVEVNGSDMTGLWRHEKRLKSIETVDQEGEASDSCEFVFDDRPPHVEWPPVGANLRLWLGPSDNDLTEIGTYTIDAPKASCPPDELTITGHAATFVPGALATPMQAHRSRTWSAISIGDLVETIARDHGLLPRIQLSLAGEVLDPMEQIEESDLAFLKRVLGEYEARVRVKPASGHRAGALEVVGAGSQLPQVVLTRKDVERWDAPLGERVKPGTVLAQWYVPKTGATGYEKAGDADPVEVLKHKYTSPKRALKAAKARLKDTKRKSGQLSVELTELRTNIFAGTAIAMTGFRSEIDTIWNVVEVKHSVTAEKARTSLVAERAVV